MPLDDPYGPGIWGQWSQEVADQPLIPGKIAQQTADVAKTKAATAQTQAETDAQTLKNTEAGQTSAPRVTSLNAAYGSTTAQDNLTQMGASQTQVGDIVSHYDWSDPDEAKAGDAALAKARDGGNGIAGSLVGRVTSQNADRLSEAYGAKTPHEARAAMTLTGTGEPGDPMSSLYGAPKQPDITPQALAGVPTEKLQAGLATSSTLLQALEQIRGTKDPAQAAALFDAYAASHNRSDLVGKLSRDPGILTQLEGQVRVNMAMVNADLARRSAGLPAPVAPMSTEKLGANDTLFGVTRKPDGTPVSTKLGSGGGEWTVNPWIHDNAGNAMETNSQTSERRVLQDTQGRQTVFGQRVEVANSLYDPKSQQWADYVQGKGTGLTQAEALKYGESQAQKEGAGLWTPAQTQQRAEAIATDIITAQNQGAAPAGGPKAPSPAPAPAPQRAPTNAGVAALKANLAKGGDSAAERAKFDAVFGQGASKRYVP